MAVLKAEISLCTLKTQALIAETGLGCLSYHDKSERGSYTGTSGHSYAEEKQCFVESHGKVWIPKNKRPNKLREHIKELEDMLNNAQNVFCWWKSADIIQMFLNNGMIFWLNVDQQHADIIKVTKDTSLAGKLTLNQLSDVISTPQFIALCSLEKSKIEMIQFTKGLLEGPAKKISALEPKISQMDLPGRPGGSFPRYMQVSPSNDALIVYWPITSEEAWPWAPMSNDMERANLTIVSVVNGKPVIVAYTKTEADPVDIQFSAKNSQKFISVEKSIGSKNCRAELCTYELTKSSIHKTAHNSVALSGALTYSTWDNSQHNLLLISDDQSIVLHSDNLKSTRSTKAAFSPDFVQWHPSGCMVVVLDLKGDLQIFDKALSCIHLTMEGLEYVPQLKLSAFFRLSPHVKSIKWCKHSSHSKENSAANSFLIAFDRGPIGLMKLTGGDLCNSQINCRTLVTEHLKASAPDKATELLTVMSWDKEALDCFHCLVNITNNLLRQPLNKLTEGLLESVLGCFYAPQRPLSEVVILEYRMHVGNLARRFFHHLIRYSRFDKAFLLAVDINARDLFMDIYYSALDKGQSSLAAAAKLKASQCEEELVFSDSCSSMNGDLISDGDDYFSQCSSTDDSIHSLEHVEAIVKAHINGLPPPLPPRKPSRVATSSSGASTPPLPPRNQRNGILSSTESTPPLPPRARHRSSDGPPSNPAGERVTAYTGVNGFTTDKYKHVSGCTLPSGYTYDLDPAVSRQLLTEYSAMMVDDPLDFQQKTPILKPNQALDRKPVKVIHFGLV